MNLGVPSENPAITQVRARRRRKLSHYTMPRMPAFRWKNAWCQRARKLTMSPEAHLEGLEPCPQGSFIIAASFCRYKYFMIYNSFSNKNFHAQIRKFGLPHHFSKKEKLDHVCQQLISTSIKSLATPLKVKRVYTRSNSTDIYLICNVTFLIAISSTISHVISTAQMWI